MNEPSQEINYEFAGYRLDGAKRTLLGPDGARVKIKPKVLDTLLLFAANPGELLSKEMMLEHIWGDVKGDDNALNQHISTLRKIFGERPGDNCFIVTVPTVGYRFVATLTEDRSEHRGWRYLARPVSTKLVGEQAYQLSCPIKATQQLAFDAWTQPHHISKWYAPEQATLTSCRCEPSVGGLWRFELRGPDDLTVAQRGEFLQVEPHSTLVYSESWEGHDIPDLRIHVTFTPTITGSLITIRVRCPSPAIRDEILSAGVNEEAELALMRFAVYLTNLS